MSAFESNQALAVYGSEKDVTEVGTRILKLLPGAKQMGTAGAMALAQVAIAMGLNPFVGEIWAIPGQGGFQIMVGIKGLRRAAKIQAKREGAVFPYYRVQYRLPSDEENSHLKLQPGDIAIVAELEILLQANHPFYRTNDFARFIVEGIGVVRSGTRSKMEPVNLVRKRAEAQAIKTAFDLPFGGESSDDNFTLDGDFDVYDASQNQPEPQETKAPEPKQPEPPARKVADNVIDLIPPREEKPAEPEKPEKTGEMSEGAKRAMLSLVLNNNKCTYALQEVDDAMAHETKKGTPFLDLTYSQLAFLVSKGEEEGRAPENIEAAKLLVGYADWLLGKVGWSAENLGDEPFAKIRVALESELLADTPH